MEITCGMCHGQVPYGAHVCTHCQGTIIYGPTHGEKKAAIGIGLFIGLLTYVQISNSLGVIVSFGGLFLGAAIGMAAGAFVVFRLQKGKIRTFRHLAR